MLIGDAGCVLDEIGCGHAVVMGFGFVSGYKDVLDSEFLFHSRCRAVDVGNGTVDDAIEFNALFLLVISDTMTSGLVDTSANAPVLVYFGSPRFGSCCCGSQRCMNAV